MKHGKFKIVCPQAGRKPAVVLSQQPHNGKVGLALFCPISNQIKGYPFEVVMPPNVSATGAILSSQVKSMDWRTRNAELIGVLPPKTISEVVQKIGLLLTR